MLKGKCKFFNVSKGYGFVIDDTDGSEYFVHVTGTKTTIKEGDSIQFELADGKKGPNAINVSVI